MPPRKPVAWIVICLACVSGAEGLRQVAYRDFNGIPTVCFGETRGVKMGDRKTVEECKAMLDGRLEEFGQGVDRCVKVALPPARKAALVSFAYNVGVGTFCKSSVVRKINAGDTLGGCDALLLYTKASGVTLPGLVTRREKERKLCVEGLT